MKRLDHITSVFRSEVGSEAFDRLSQIAECKAHGSSWSLALPEGHESTCEAISILTGLGLRPWDRQGPRIEGKEFWHVIRREYDETDFENTMLLEIRADDLNEHLWRSDQSGRIEIKRIAAIRSKDRHVLKTFGDGGGFIVSDEVRREFECKLAASEIEYIPVDVKSKSATPILPVWWELSTRVTLPPVSDVLRLRDNWDRPVARGHIGFTRIDEPPFAPRELHYIRSELEAVGDFTLARSFEQTGHAENDRHLIASQRFYRFCIDHNIKCDWIPVRIDED